MATDQEIADLRQDIIDLQQSLQHVREKLDRLTQVDETTITHVTFLGKPIDC